MVDVLLKQKGTSFKPSAKKKDTNFEFVPVNLHIQRMWVQNVTTRKSEISKCVISFCSFLHTYEFYNFNISFLSAGVYDVITVGAFSAYSRRFRQGGLLRLLNNLKTYYPSVTR